jgi:uncharacterized oligopeptide transporter (OPT) family protein
MVVPTTSRAEPALAELTIRAVLLGGVITLLVTAANAYLGLRVGLTFATSIPAAVISMAVLRHFASSNILENNIRSLEPALSMSVDGGRVFGQFIAQVRNPPIRA